jgi:GNAT superfamily N-acetyltransferase
MVAVLDVALQRRSLRRGAVVGGYAFPPPDASVAIDELLADEEMGGIWLLKHRDLVVGVLVLTFGYDIEFGGPLAVITDLFVLQEHRRKGTGTAAVRFAEWFCRGRGIRALELQVERSNSAALAFYLKVGFEVHDRVPMTRRLVVRDG